MHQRQRNNVLQIATRKQLTSSPDEEVAINIQSDSIMRQTNKVILLQVLHWRTMTLNWYFCRN